MDEATLAVHDTEIKHLQKDMDKLVEDVEEIKKSLYDISHTLAEAKGGWRIFMILGTLGATIGAAAGWFFENFTSK